jgi:hypothetical protein
LFVDKNGNDWVIISNTASALVFQVVAQTPPSGTNATTSIISSGKIGNWNTFWFDGSYFHPGLTSTAGIDVGDATAWVQSTAYVVNQWVTAPAGTCECTTAGTSASTGTGPSSDGAGQTDNTVTWSCWATGSMYPGIDPSAAVSSTTIWTFDYTHSPGLLKIGEYSNSGAGGVQLWKSVIFTPSQDQFFSFGLAWAYPMGSGVGNYLNLAATTTTNSAGIGPFAPNVFATGGTAITGTAWNFSNQFLPVTNWGFKHAGGSGSGQTWTGYAATPTGGWGRIATGSVTAAPFLTTATFEYLQMQFGTNTSGPSQIYSIDYFRRSITPQP